jgi:hypothetical protein
MSLHGTNWTTSDVRLESAFGGNAEVGFGDVRAVDDPQQTARLAYLFLGPERTVIPNRRGLPVQA